MTRMGMTPAERNEAVVITAWIADVLHDAITGILPGATVGQAEESTLKILLPQGTRMSVQITVDQHERTDQ